MRKLWSLAAFSFLSCVVSACVGGNPYYVKKPSEIRANGKKVLFLPVFMGNSFFPPVADSPDKFRYDNKFQESVRKAMGEILPTIDLVALAVLKNRDYFEIIDGSKNDLAKTPPEITRSEMFWRADTVRTYEWFHNYEYVLTPAVAAKLAAQYNVDAIFFHYVQVKKTWVTEISGPGFTSASGVTTYPTRTMPIDTVVYLPTLYDKAGNIMYGGIRYSDNPKQPAIMNLNGDRLIELEAPNSGDGQRLAISAKPLDKVIKGFGHLDKHNVLDILNKHWIPMGDQPGGSLAGL